MKPVQIVLWVCLFLIPGTGFAQYFHFSQNNYSRQRVNPSYVAFDDYAYASGIYRKQQAAEELDINSSYISGSYPLIFRRNNHRWAGVGITLLDDRSGQGGIFKVNEVGVSYAIRVQIDKQQSLYLGLRSVYSTRKFSLDGLYTGSQYIPGRGFNQVAGSGETPDDFRQDYFTFSSGMLWQANDRNGRPLAHLGLSIFDFNNVHEDLFSDQNVVPATAVFDGSLSLTGPTQFGVDPVMLLSYSSGKTELNIGGIWNYTLSEENGQMGKVNVITRYVIGKYGIAGIQFENEKLSVGFSYDVPLSSQVGNQGTIEFGIAIKQLIKREPKNKKVNEPASPLKKIAQTLLIEEIKPKKWMFETLPSSIKIKKVRLVTHAQMTESRAGDMIFYPYEREQAELRFYFDLNSTKLNKDSEIYLQGIADLLKDQPHLMVRIVGHSDSQGEETYNMKLSIARAARVRDYLISLGVKKQKMTVEGKGESNPIQSNDTPEGRAKNRRVEFYLL